MEEKLNRLNGRVVIGIVLILLGGVIFLANLSLFDFGFDYTWEMVIILIGGLVLTKWRESIIGLALVGYGVISILLDIFEINWGEFIANFWPIGLIIIGLLILFKRNERSKSNQQKDSLVYRDKIDEREDDYFDEFALFSSDKKIIKSLNFKGCSITNIFAASELDLIESSISNENAVIDILSIFGGIDIRIPEDWNINIEVSTLFGGFDDKRFIRSNAEDTKGTLTIKGFVIFGGCDIKN